MVSPWHVLFVIVTLGWALHEVYILRILNQGSGRLRQGDERGSAKLLTVILSLALILPIVLSDAVRETWLAPMDAGRRVGILLMVGGVLLRAAAAQTLGSAWSRDLGRFAGEPLRTHGVYARLRHPSYTGFVLTTIGLAIAWPHPLIAAPALIVPVVTFTLRTQVEERILERLYGAEYARYRERTWRLIPFVF